MQLKTIQKVIKNKLVTWLSTIEDSNLRKEVENSLLVSGGCITSMFQDIPVNDYDIYIQDINVLKRLAQYYCPGIVLDGRERNKYIAERFPKYDIENPQLFNECEEYTPEILVRLLTLKPDQIKLDIVSQGIKKELKKDAEGNPEKYQVAFLSQNAISLTDNVQIVTRFSGTPEEIHKNFDFIHATNYFTFKNGIVTNEAALISILTKSLKYQGSLYPLTSVIRIKKFVLKGWTINAGEMLKIMFQISELNLRDIVVLEEQLIGVDIAYFATLIEILRGLAPETITPSYLNVIIDKVFNNYDEEEVLPGQNEQ